MDSRINRRSMLAALFAAPVAVAAEEPPLLMEWSRYAITLNDGTSEKGIMVSVASMSADVRAFEVSVKWRDRFLGSGPLQQRCVLVPRGEDGHGWCKVATGGDEAWTLVQAWGLHQREYSASQVGSE